MAGVRKKPLSSGKFQGWYTDHRGKQRFFTGTRNRAETKRMALRLDDEHRQIRMGYKPLSRPSDQYGIRLYDTVVDEYLAWGKAQGGRGGRSWGETHLRMRRSHLFWWRDRLKFRELKGVEHCLPQVEEALRDMQAAGRAGRTMGSYAEALRSFFRWCVERDYLRHDPLTNLQPFDATPRSTRRALTGEEIRCLLEHCAPHRRLLYEVAFCSGLRANELRSLSINHLDTERCGVRLDAAWTKNRKDGFQPLPRSLIDRLSTWARAAEASRLYATAYQARNPDAELPKAPLLYVPTHPARELERDLVAAGISKETVEGKVDFHACRVAYITLLMESDATLKEAQELARHANPQITANVYARVRGEAIKERVERLGETVLGENYAHSMHHPVSGASHLQVYRGNEEVEAAGIEPASGSLQP